MPTKKMYTTAEASEILSIKRTRLFTLISSGELGSLKVGSRRFIPEQDLTAFVDRLRFEQGLSPGRADVVPRAFGHGTDAGPFLLAQ